MSDGDSATPDRRPSDQSSQDNLWLTRSPLPKPGAAPWERRGGIEPIPDDDVAHGEVPHGEVSHGEVPYGGEPTGSHTDGVTVADLIAKLAGTPRRGAQPAAQPAHHRMTPTESEAPADRPADEDYDHQHDGQHDGAHDDDHDVDDHDVDDHSGPHVDYEYYESAYDQTFDPGPATEVLPAARAAALPAVSVGARSTPEPARIGPPTEHAPPTSRRGRRTAMVVGRIAAALLAVFAVALTGSAWQWQSTKNRSFNQVSALDPNSRDIMDPNAQLGDVNFLIVGVDSRLGQNADMGAGSTDDAAGARSDSIMLVNIPANRKRVVAVSFPRDLSIKPMECEHWEPATGQYGPATNPDSAVYGLSKVYTETKLNSAYAVGGPRCLVKVIQKLSGLSVSKFMAVDFAGFATMVDALGGVEVCSPTPLKDYELGTVLPTAGRQIIDGHTALQYVRARQVTTEVNGDYGRIKRQQRFASSLLRSLISKDTFFSLSKLNNVVNMFIADSSVDGVTTKDLVDLGQSVQGVNAGRITFVTVPTVGYADEYGNEVPRTEDLRALFDAIINDDPLPEEKTADSAPAPETSPSPSPTTPAPVASAAAAGHGDLVDAVTTDPGAITVRVSNSTGEDGLASTAARQLKTHGFNVVDPDDYQGSLKSTTVFFSPGNEQAAATVASAFKNPTVERVSGMGQQVRVVLGADFNAVVSPTPSGSPIQVHVVRGTSTETTRLPEDLTVTNAADTTCD